MGSGGGVRRRPDGLWEGRYYAADGRRRSVYRKTEREAQAALRRALIDADNGIRPVARTGTVGAFLAEWLETSVAPRCRPRTAESYRETVKRYIVPAIGTKTLAKLEPADVSRMLAGLTARGTLSSTTVRYVYSVLRIALGRALKQGRVVRNVCTLVDAPAKSTPEIRPLTADEARAFLDSVAEDRLRALYIAAIGTGLRQGELLALRWQDIDLEAGTLTVRHSLQRGTRALAEPKTERARRTLALGPTITAALHDHRRQQRVVGPAAFVFTGRNGAALDGANVTHALQASLARAGLPRQRFHDLRHAFATLMIEDGEDLAVVSKALGHANLSTTADVYAHLTPAMLERAAARMDAILGNAASGRRG